MVETSSLDENRTASGTEGNGNLLPLTKESTPVEQGHDFATSTGILDREEMSDLFDISTENPAVGGSSTDNTLMHGLTEKSATFSLFSQRVKNTLGIFFPFYLKTASGDEEDIQKEEDDNGEIADFESQVSLNTSTHENEASENMETSYSDRFGAVRTINKTIDGIQQSREFHRRGLELFYEKKSGQ